MRAAAPACLCCLALFSFFFGLLNPALANASSAVSDNVRLTAHGGHLQRGRHLSHQRKRLTLFQQPLRTLYYFSACMTSASGRGLSWLIHSPVTLFVLLPLLVTYGSLKYTGAPQLAQ